VTGPEQDIEATWLDEPARPWLRGATVVGVSLWFVFTFGAHRMVPVVIWVAERVEAALGFDVAQQVEEDE
jgi:hypothetical protein